MPRKTVALVLWAGVIGAAIFIYFTFPRTKEEIPHSNNQRPYPSSPGPNGIPVPENVPQPNTPKPGPGPNLRVMAWANDDEAKALGAELDAFAARTGLQPTLTLSRDASSYRQQLQDAVAEGTPPDLCLVEARDFSGLDPEHDLAPLLPPEGFAQRSLAAFQAGSQLRAVPDEFSVDLLFYHPRDFDRAGLASPGRHWTWDILEAMARALAAARLNNDMGEAIYPLELPSDFDFWNLLCMQAGHAALDRNTWHLADAESRESRLRGLGLIHEFFHQLSVTAPPAPAGTSWFALGRSSLLIGPSELAATLPKDSFGVTLVPADLCRASVARANGWAVLAASPHAAAAATLARFLAGQPLHTGWTSTLRPENDVAENPDDPVALSHEALEEALLPRVEPRTERLAQLLDEQIRVFARNDDPATPENLNARIEAEYLDAYAPPAERAAAEAGPAMPTKASGPALRGL